MKREKVVLAYSGGLDTSCCIEWLREKHNLDVITFTANMGEEGSDATALKRRAILTGAVRVYVRDVRQEFLRDFVWSSFKAGAVYEGKYFLATALGRPLIAKHLVDVARQEGAAYIAHGCTGKGNDQVRIEVTAKILSPSLRCLAPVRSWHFRSRQEQVEYCLARRIPVEVTKKSPYSLDKNLWGISIEAGPLEDPWCAPPEDCYHWTKSPQRSPNRPALIRIAFRKGVPVALNGRAQAGIRLLTALNRLAGLHGVGRIDAVENRLVGIKSREVYEAPAATVLHMARKEVESLVLDRELLHFKEGLSQRYARLVYDGLWYTPLRIALDRFFSETSKRVTGEVQLKLYKGSATVMGRRSPHSMYQMKLATYGEGDVFDQKKAEGFIHLWGLPYTSGK